MDFQVASLVGSFKKTNRFLVPLYALMKLFTINGVYIKAFGKLKMVNARLTKLRLNNWPNVFVCLFVCLFVFSFENFNDFGLLPP